MPCPQCILKERCNVYHSHFVIGMSRVGISIGKQEIVTKVSWDFPQCHHHEKQNLRQNEWEKEKKREVQTERTKIDGNKERPSPLEGKVCPSSTSPRIPTNRSQQLWALLFIVQNVTGTETNYICAGNSDTTHLCDNSLVGQINH